MIERFLERSHSDLVHGSLMQVNEQPKHLILYQADGNTSKVLHNVSILYMYSFDKHMPMGFLSVHLTQGTLHVLRRFALFVKLLHSPRQP